ncbi:MAG TPA: tRNA dihydrouridine(20/20a) synthase DusA [Alteromonas australica]|jgi:tRNA-dihydrouridine synthase A|uniref:tRNA-dihydrouridine(20/20a) synthase n=2 Tax=Alteromonas australica TaxID=589873 RepID=A0A349TPG8_9ALTE|nr:tRNA dihydrouridine(20/20a) synthase DusA [Alteromonas australica]MAF70923.1 tRNA dihydrouridine(20/20a) synthase DusA [Alteromonas sp.]MBU34105.1 tRNA dihydrouridine(20/20a) synthase DusA [Alteromonas sp.]HAU25933.1 tRNA dihydrouridine(20/20a) synthase DusA [Alteromonas australica]HAW75739.1 tRNA dihydrouridine(20/20a) synthase DusA [Alteromonas australica]|tara:strand:- start:754 stop:1776 length:1023 start_codon:yes stop_codon:yes gene_type:complete
MSDISFNRKLSVAPMLDWTDRHCRFFLRLLSKHTLLYTEMVTTGAIIYGKGDYLGFNTEEHPVAVQLGGSAPSDMAKCAELSQERGYDEVNINVGCPSDRVKNGSFGACLMAQPDVVASCVKAMQSAVDIPVTVKCRIGIDDMDEDEDFARFIDIVADAGCKTFIVHARKAWLQGLSPKENREVPPLNYPRVYNLKKTRPDLSISINGGIKTLDDVNTHLLNVDGVMMGREVYANPYILANVDSTIMGDESAHGISRREVVMQMQQYIERQEDPYFKPWHAARHMLGLFQGQAGGRIWRRYLSQNGTGKNPDPNLLMNGLAEVENAQREIDLYNKAKANA